MIRTSLGQISAETAKVIYRHSGEAADSLVRMGKIHASERGVAFAKLATERLAKSGIQVSREMAATAKQSLPAVEALLPASSEAAKASAAGASKVMVRGASAAAPAAAGASQAALQVARNTLRAGAPVAAVCFIGESAYHVVQYRKGAITKDQLVKKTARSAAGNAGGLGGAAAGAAIGSMFFPGVGTVIGGVVGGVAGGITSAWGMSKFL